MGYSHFRVEILKELFFMAVWDYDTIILKFFIIWQAIADSFLRDSLLNDFIFTLCFALVNSVLALGTSKQHEVGVCLLGRLRLAQRSIKTDRLEGLRG
jgi:hypothetical protein